MDLIYNSNQEVAQTAPAIPSRLNSSRIDLARLFQVALTAVLVTTASACDSTKNADHAPVPVMAEIPSTQLPTTTVTGCSILRQCLDGVILRQTVRINTTSPGAVQFSALLTKLDGNSGFWPWQSNTNITVDSTTSVVTLQINMRSHPRDTNIVANYADIRVVGIDQSPEGQRSVRQTLLCTTNSDTPLSQCSN